MGVAQGSLKARTGSDEVHTSVPRSESMVFQERPILSLGTLPHSVCPEEPTTHSCLLSRSKPLSSYEERTMILKDASKELNPYRRGWPKPSKRVAEAWWNNLNKFKLFWRMLCNKQEQKSVVGHNMMNSLYNVWARFWRLTYIHVPWIADKKYLCLESWPWDEPWHTCWHTWHTHKHTHTHTKKTWMDGLDRSLVDWTEDEHDAIHKDNTFCLMKLWIRYLPTSRS